MHGGAAFEDLLDRQLGGVHGVSAMPRNISRGTATTFGFFFLESSLPAATRPIAGLRRSLSTSVSVPVYDAGSSPRGVAGSLRETERDGAGWHSATRRERRFSSHQRAAIGELIALGALIDEGASSGQLRSAFRSLARRYHPDRHSSASAGDRARLSAQFARLCDAYRLLTTAA
jgi:curved DNA-binding protein CbpA